ncbi:MAG: hypothetical protein KDE24_07195, partial [Caldilinea sp.]|nr:hypothetical protein [Caldilinea sp.]
RQHYIQQLSRMVQIDEMTIASRVQASARTMRAGIEARRRSSTAPAPEEPPVAAPPPRKEIAPAA